MPMSPVDLLFPLFDQVRRWQVFRQRRRNSQRYHELTEDVVSSWDQAAFDELYRKHLRYFHRKHRSKYLDARYWVRDALDRFHLYGLDKLPPGQRILDIGCGAGYFLVVARHLGHDVRGLDIADSEIFNDLISFFKIPRVECGIHAGVPIPDFGQTFDVVTAFMTAFDNHPDGTPWDAAAWTGFLVDLRRQMVGGGLVIVKFNVNKKIRRYYSPAAKQAILALDEYRAEFFRDSMKLVAR